ncbi:hypothetical protein EPO33_05415 [Patescibacteria group bacterium]|nr:MAG: hypothetical protein EPO33_05415 [Patescibacteria group bacterium]
MPTLILGLVGEKAGGKGTIAKHLIEKHGARCYSFGGILKDVLTRLHIPLTRENYIKISVNLRAAFGEPLFARVMAEDVAKDTSPLVVVDGIRRVADIEELRKISGFHLLYVTADAKLRWERSVKRAEKVGEADMTFEQFMTEEQAPTETSIAEVAREAEITVDNNGTFEELHAQVEKAVAAFGYAGPSLKDR